MKKKIPFFNILEVRDDVMSGTPLNVSMREKDLFPALLIQMVAIGEEAGSLDSMLEKVAPIFLNNSIFRMCIIYVLRYFSFDNYI